MEKLLFVFIATFSLLISINGQTDPPPPLIYAPPDIAQLQEYSAPRYGFKIVFAGIPYESQELSEEENIFKFRTRQNGSTEMVKVTQLVLKGSESVSDSTIFDRKRDEYHADKKSTLESEKDVFVGSRLGKEFRFNQVLFYRIIRVFIVKNHIYELSVDVTNWHILQQFNQDKIREFENESLRFFESFQFQPISISGSGNING